jgi:hypothetical protein
LFKFFSNFSLLLLIPYVVLLEVYAFPGPTFLITDLVDRRILYTVPLPLLFFSLGFTYWHYSESRAARDAARQWYSITPHRNRVRSASVPPSANVVPPPMRGGAEASTLPLRPSALQFYPAEGEPEELEAALPSRESPAYLINENRDRHIR